jgi:glycosyltransferase involved in cell wall biosynthesis
MSHIDVCAVVPTYNREHLVVDCINSLLNQSYPVAKIIVVNDGSTDNTAQVLSSFGDKITLINKGNGGKASALNIGLEHCTSDWVWICDDDDIADADGLKKLIGCLGDHPDAKVVLGGYVMFFDTPTGRHYEAPAYKKRSNESNYSVAFMERMFTCQFAMLVKKVVYDAVGSFNERLVRSQDYEMTLRIVRRFPAIETDETIFYQRQHAGQRGSGTDSFSHSESEEKWLKYDRQIFEKISSDYDLLEFRPSYCMDAEPIQQRTAALVEKACILAQRAIWSESIDAIQSAAGNSPRSLLPETLQLAEQLIWSFLPWTILLQRRDWQQRLTHVRRSSRSGDIIVSAMFRPVVWQIKKSFVSKKWRDSRRLAKLMLSVLGPYGSIKRIVLSILK